MGRESNGFFWLRWICWFQARKGARNLRGNRRDEKGTWKNLECARTPAMAQVIMNWAVGLLFW